MNARLFLVLTLVSAGFVWPASAAPQMLGVATLDTPRPLICDDGVCVAHVSAFCLQPARPAPAAGTVYAPVAGTVTLVLALADGGHSRIAADGRVAFTTLGGYSSLRASLPKSLLAAHGAVAAAIEIGPRTTLAPRAQAGDPDPQTALDIALASGPRRIAAEAWFERPGAPRADAARLASALISAIPDHGAATNDIWESAAADARAAGFGAAGIDRAGQAYRACRWLAAEGYVDGLKGRLARKHDAWMMEINGDYWRGLGGV